MANDRPSWRAQLADADPHALPGPRWARLALLLLLTAAGALRLLGWPSIPFTHDEISALVRLYPTLGETIQRGVIELDTHPPGVQVLEWLWTRLVGRTEGWVQLPFIAASLAGILFMYRFALAWTTATVALAVTALLATLQYTVLYGQLARPYAIGLFTVALLADQWTRWLAWQRTGHLVGAAVAAALCAYTHHFAALVAALIMASGLALAPATGRLRWLLACGAGLLLYLPNVPILFRQLGLGGLQEWLAPPDAHWFPDHLWWVAHTSWPLAALMVLAGVASFAGWWRGTSRAWPIVPVLLVWVLVPAALGYGYSVWRAPVLQHSVLVFSFPFALVLLLGGLHLRRPVAVLGLVGVLAGTATFTLFTVRQHHRTALTSKYEAFLQAATDAAAHPGTVVVIDAPNEVLDRLEQEPRYTAARGHYLRLRELGSNTAVLDRIRTDRPAEVVLGLFHSTDRALPALIQHSHPVLLERLDLVEGQVLRFGTTGDGLADTTAWSTAAPGMLPAGWQVEPAAIGTDSLAAQGWDLGGREYGVLFQASVPGTHQPNDVLELLLDATALDTAGLALEAVIELRSVVGDHDSLLVYRSASAAACALRIGERGTVVVALPLSRALSRHPGLMLRAYVWNRDRGHARVHGLRLRWREGDPALYGLVEPIHGPWRFAPK
ncbi:MAG: glycosyltransferase family 39 protein [Flavobacteriales bacterium]|nr:glycosyltransferase family 39 protein [Flavobacteriales bacterium]